MKEWKNKTIDLFGTKWRIQFVPEVFILDEDNSDYWVTGAAYHQEKLIKVALNDSNHKKFTDDEIYLTLLHELVHAVFMTGQYIQCNEDEPLVEWVAKCLRSLTKQKII